MVLFLLPLTSIFEIKNMIISLIFIIVYGVYYKLFRFYIWRQTKSKTKGKRNIGKAIPAFPNGWYQLMPSHNLIPGQIEYIDRFGRNLALFRGLDNIVYCLDAYCPHMGANLAIGGIIKYNKCIQCPFHGWVFDGETGNCVMGSKLTPKTALKYEYSSDLGSSECEEAFHKNQSIEQVKINKYLIKEVSNFIFIWLHSNDKKRMEEPPYFPLDISHIQQKLSHRGYSINLVRSHVQDIAENGADILHFLYVHNVIIPYFVKASWKPNWIKASDPNLRQILKHEKEEINEFRMKLFDKYVNEGNKDYIGVVTLDNNISILGCKEFSFFSLTAFQVGPGLVYLFLKGFCYEVMFFQHTTSLDKYDHQLYHQIYTSNYFPYWISALYLKLEAVQVENDGLIWDNKIFGYSPYYNPESNTDKKLLEWRNWYSKFYEGCKKAEEQRDLNW